MATSPLDMQYDYRAGMPKACSDALRHLRRIGFAVAIIKPEVVGHPIHRSSVEQSMVTRGVQRASELSHSNLSVSGRQR